MSVPFQSQTATSAEVTTNDAKSARTRTSTALAQKLAETAVVTVDPGQFEVDLSCAPHEVRLALEEPLAGRDKLRARGALADALIACTSGMARRIQIQVTQSDDNECLELLDVSQVADTTPRRRVLIFGDSNCWGWDPASAERGCHRHPAGVRFADVAARFLKDDCEVLIDGLVNRTTDLDAPRDWGCVKASGFNGASALAAAIARSMPLDAVVIQLGTNDLQTAFGRDAGEIAQAVHGLVQIVRTAGGGVNTQYGAPEPIVVVPPAIRPIAGSRLARAFDGAQDKHGYLAASFRIAMPDVRMIDAHELLAGIRGSDGVHLTASEHRVLGAAIAQTVAALWQAGDTTDFSVEDNGITPAGADDHRAYVDHLKRLSPESRRLRFGSPLSDERLAVMAATDSSWKLLLREKGTVRGALELHPMGDGHAEIALSLEDSLQGRGHGRRLFEAGLEWAGKLEFSKVLVVCDANNRRMRRLLSTMGVEMQVEDCDVTAWIDVAVSPAGPGTPTLVERPRNEARAARLAS